MILFGIRIRPTNVGMIESTAVRSGITLEPASKFSPFRGSAQVAISASPAKSVM